MRALQLLFGRRWIGWIWTLLIAVLLTLPGQVLPREQTFFIPQMDKLVHMTLFAGFGFIWSAYFWRRGGDSRKLANIYLRLFLAACAFGYAMELVQKYWIPFRDYETGDILADALGAALAYGWARWKMVPGR